MSFRTFFVWFYFGVGCIGTATMTFFLSNIWYARAYHVPAYHNMNTGNMVIAFLWMTMLICVFFMFVPKLFRS